MKAYTNLSQILTLENAYIKDGRKLTPSDLSLLSDGAIVFDNEKIHWLGKTKNLPQEFNDIPSFNLQGHVLTPELVDSHTHAVFGGNRSQEYVDRLNGISYEEIANRGGGILFTMRETQSSTSHELFSLAKERVERINSYGVGTIEIKSGYGLSYEKEKELSLIIDKLKKHFRNKITIFNTYLAAHDVPRIFSGTEEYLDRVVLPLLDELAPLKIIDAVDIFHEKNYFSAKDVEKLFKKAAFFGINCKIHADELNENQGAELAVKYKALSADHLLKISDNGINALSASDTVATLLPGTAFFIGKPLAPARKMLDSGVKVAIASDYNPGSCHCDNLLLIASIAAAQLKMNQAELWCGITLNAAHALGLRDQGVLKVGMKPRFSLFKVNQLSDITYEWGKNFSISLP